MDLIERALGLFDQVIVALGTNAQKDPLLELSDRIELCRKALHGIENVEVDGFNTLLVDYARKKGARHILRGLRNVADFEYEFQMVQMNRSMAPGIDYVFLTPSEHHSFISSSLVREIAAYGGDVSQFVPPVVFEALTQKGHS